MKIAILWGIVFGTLQGIISLIVASAFSSPDVAALACVGLLLSFALTIACSLTGAIHAKAFVPGFIAGVIATGIDVAAGLIGYLISPAMLDLGLLANVFSFAFSIGVGILLSAVGAGVGVFFNRQILNKT